MTGHGRREVALASALAGVAGYVDAIGFVHLGGYFISFMSGNLTHGGVELAQGSPRGWALAMGLVAFFVMGVVAGSVIGHFGGRRRRPAVLLFVTVTLAIAAITGTTPALAFAAPPIMALAMGAENSVFERNGEVSIGLTYMTGTLVKMAQQIANGFLGGPSLAWLRYFSLWMLLSVGAVVGGLAYGAMGLASLWIAVALTAVGAAGAIYVPAAGTAVGAPRR